MGFWQHLTDSYDQNVDALKKKYPLSTTSISNNSDIIAVVVIDGDGNFVRVDKIDKKSKPTKKGPGNPLVNITIPASEESMKRTSTAILPYPVFEEYSYLKKLLGRSDKYIKKLYEHCDHVSEYKKKLKANKQTTKNHQKKWEDYERKIKKIERYGRKYDAYIAQLKNFVESGFATDQIMAIYQYISKGTLASNIQEHDKNLEDKMEALKSQKVKLSKDEKEELKNLERNKIKPNDKTYIIFQVETPGKPQTKLWEDGDFFNAWYQYYLSIKNDAKSLDYITGGKQPTATFHPKKISNVSGNAKLISKPSNEYFYTYQGKFSEFSEAVSVGYESSQKAHQFLRYLINERGHVCGEQVILSFTIGSMEKLLPPPVEEKSIWEVIQDFSLKTESDIQISLRAETGFDYADALRKSLGGFGHGSTLKQHAKTAVIALDAATTGRLSITFYRELDKSEYLERVADWHDACKWHQKFWDNVDEKYIPYCGAPSVDKIIEAVYGKPRGGKDDGYTKIKKAARERLLRCVFDGAFLPADYVIAAVRRASNPLGVTKNGKFDRNGFEQIVSTACALVRKDFQQRNKEDYKLSIELERNDRDYLYGRLLGAADKLEEYALCKQGNSRENTSAMRYMQVFSHRPYRTWHTIHDCLNPYIQKVKGSFAFSEIQEIKDKFEPGDYENDTPLNGSYLIGYYHERAYIEDLVKAAADKKKQ